MYKTQTQPSSLGPFPSPKRYFKTTKYYSSEGLTASSLMIEAEPVSGMYGFSVSKFLLDDGQGPREEYCVYRGADKSLARPGRKQVTATKL